MIVDTIVKIDTVFVEKASEVLSQKDLLEQVISLDNSFNGHMNLLLIIFGLGIALGGILVPLYVSFKQKKDFHELEKKFKEELKSIKKEIENKLNDEFEEKVKVIANDWKKDIEQNVNGIKYMIKIESYYNSSILFISHKFIGMGIAMLLKSFMLSLVTNIYDKIENIIDDLDACKDIDLIINIDDTETELGKNIQKYIDDILELMKEDEIKQVYIKRLKEKVENIIESNNQRKNDITFQSKTEPNS